MRIFCFLWIVALVILFGGCTFERAQEQVLSVHANGAKKTSIWVYGDGEIKKRNEWYSDGIKELEIPYKNNLPHGDFKRWTGFGDVALLGHYKKGLKEGKWLSLFNDKKVEAERFYKEDHPVGDWEGWHYNRHKSFEEHYNRDGLAVGVWKKWFDNGALQQEGNCHAKWDPKREIKSAVSGAGFIKRFSKNCQLLEEFSCENGVLQGPFTLYYESYETKLDSSRCGKGKPRVKGSLRKDSALVGSVTYFRADGSPMKQEFWNQGGRRDSLWRWFDEQGEVVRESSFDSAAVAWGSCEGNARIFCAETSFVGGFVGVIEGSGLDQKRDFGQSIGKFPASLRYTKENRPLLYEELWTVDANSKTAEPMIAQSRSFYPDSMGATMASEGSWKDGKRHGIWRNWYRSGILRDSLTYVMGERVGEQFSYDSTGKLTIHKTEAGKMRPVIMHLLNE